MSHSLINQSHLVAIIDRLVKDIIFHTGYFNDIMRCLNLLYSPFMESLDHELVYAKTIDSFIYSTDAVVGTLYPSDVVWDHKKTQHFIKTLKYYKKDILLENSVWNYQEKQNQNSLDYYVRSLISHYSKLLFVRVDLKYLQESSHLITVDDFACHINKLREFIGNKKTFFKHLQGNAWALEQGYENGALHCHLLLIYDGSKRQNDWYLAKEVGEKWCEITNGIGVYYNYHNVKSKQRYAQHDRLGIGMIHRNNSQQVTNAVYTALYLTKPDKLDQHLKVWLPSMRTFGHGVYGIKKRRNLSPITK